jgi:hypothetical protein
MFGVTSSILSVKEYGGESKAEYLKGYSTNKVRLGSVNPLENVLSPITSIQQITTASADYLDNDLQYVDISFSPQNQIDLYISQSISSNNPSFDLDEYIGDPRQQYSTTYPNLDNQRKIYFEQGTGSYSGFTSSYLDYNGFIRLIQFFDNSLFKTLEAFVPARTSLSTGITFNSPVLERNKFAYANPTNSTTESIKEGEITSGSIGSEYGFLYDNLSGDKAPYYSGEISGSEINIYESYFIPNNENPYLGDINVWNSQHDADEQISLSQFALSDYNALFNNVSSSRLSANRKNIETVGTTAGQQNIIFYSGSIYFNDFIYLDGGSDTFSVSLNGGAVPYNVSFRVLCDDDLTIYDGTTSGTLIANLPSGSTGFYNISHAFNNPQITFYNSLNYGNTVAIYDLTITPTNGYSITTDAELQDSYLSLTSYKNSRHDGVKLTGNDYNVYTSGDISYGNSPVIEQYTDVFAYFDWIGNASPEIFGAGNAHILQLIDKEGNAIGLDANQNKNKFVVENIFKKDSNVNIYFISSSNTFKPGSTGSYTVYDACGYYDTILYAQSSSFNGYTFAINYTLTQGEGNFQLYSGSLDNITVLKENNYLGGSWIDALLFLPSSSNGLIYDYVNGETAPFGGTGGQSLARNSQSFNNNYIPIEKYTTLRIFPLGLENNSSSSIERTITNITPSTTTVSGSFTISPSITSSLWNSVSGNNQAYRIFKKNIQEDFVVINNITSAGPGLLIPGNYNPNLDFVQIAKKAGIL